MDKQSELWHRSILQILPLRTWICSCTFCLLRILAFSRSTICCVNIIITRTRLSVRPGLCPIFQSKLPHFFLPQTVSISRRHTCRWTSRAVLASCSIFSVLVTHGSTDRVIRAINFPPKIIEAPVSHLVTVGKNNAQIESRVATNKCIDWCWQKYADCPPLP